MLVPARLLHPSAEIGWQLWFGRAQDLDDGAAILDRQRPTIAQTMFRAGQYLPQSLVDHLLHAVRQRIESRRVDQVAARIPHQPSREVELPKRAAFAVSRALGGKPFCETGRASYR